MPLPLYGFLQGDTLVLLIFAEPEDTAAILAGKTTRAASVRVRPKPASSLRVRYKGRILDPGQTLASAGFEPLDRFDVEDLSF
jgi:hypothetical protein